MGRSVGAAGERCLGRPWELPERQFARGGAQRRASTANAAYPAISACSTGGWRRSSAPRRWTAASSQAATSTKSKNERWRSGSRAARSACTPVAVGTAPDWGVASTGPAGPHGGNMDIVETCPGNTVYLPVFVPGAFLYLGDAH